MKNFHYHRPADLNEACSLLAGLQEAQVLAGGTDLLVDIDSGIRQASHVISLKGLEELSLIEKVDSTIFIGSGCTAHMVERSPLVRETLPELAGMVVTFASPQVRTRATVGGNICSAVACGDFPVILMALGAEVELVSSKGIRRVSLKDFFIDNRETIRRGDEILTRIVVPSKPPGAAARYEKFRRRASNSLAVVSVAAYVHLEGGKCVEARIVLGAVAPTPLMAEKASRFLEGKALTGEVIAGAAQRAKSEAKPITDVRGTREFRRDLVDVLVRRAIRKCVTA
ncbi:MAG: FAD binding domain-containing protein [Fidelibacterota bacterium]